ncbi:signal peptidase I [Subtercola boreus]|uniref:Signal peptidase I n=1 Tax=Subtercola boreus TaxID=120213 RepID=A0A3E0WE10_9MICO|nr:signal peptidase I [Subtercola boreus]RFA21159.1 signal peptidase I [Subtercola boreus]RFA21542.1 signal peptidase I [Subtercola boreus]RFA27512.1 signal peptidase I [Subtercola boreus]
MQRRLARQRRPRSRWQFARDVLVILLIAIVASTLIRTFLVRSFFIPSASMASTLVDGDRVLVNELEPSLIPLQRGDVIVFSDPGGWLTATTPETQPPLVAAVNGMLDLTGISPTDSNDHLIKRVIGLPGDRVVCCNAEGQTTVNDVVLDEPYLHDPLATTLAVPFSVTVPAGSLWVEGDNRGNSKDSRLNLDTPGGGFVPIADVVGRALVTTYPITRWTYLDNYPGVFAGVPDAPG